MSLRPSFRHFPHRFLPLRPRRFQSSTPQPPKPPPSTTSKSHTRLRTLLSRLPTPLQKYTAALQGAPVSHIAAFLVLHEITAIVPLVGLAAGFHWTGWIPESWTENTYATEGAAKFRRYFERKGWFGFSRSEDGEEMIEGELINGKETGIEGLEIGKKGSRILIEVATAYAITKVLLPVRIIFSVWATPWFARVVLGPLRGGMGKVFGRGKGK